MAISSVSGLSNSPPDSAPGLYMIGLTLHSTQIIRIGRLGSFTFKSGNYLYFGSARGPGGVAARVSRHLRDTRGKRTHWHIDWLRAVAEPHLVYWSHTGTDSECEWVDILESAGNREPAGFGASDCRCGGHLLRLESNATLAQALSTMKVAIPGSSGIIGAFSE